MNVSEKDYVSQIKFQHPADLLLALVKKYQEAKGDGTQYPVVTLTVGAHTFTGVPVRIESIQKEPTLALLEPEGGIDGLAAISFIPVHSIAVVSVRNVQAQLSVIADLPYSGDAPGPLQMEKAQGSFSSSLRSILEHEVDILIDWNGDTEIEARAAILELLNATQKAFEKIAEDALGKKALQELKEVKFSFQKNLPLSASRNADALNISIGKFISANKLVADLKKQIEIQI